MNQPLQLLSLLRPDIDHFWQVELDVRYTGHHYHHLETISTWAKTQPRKLQWERASQYYIPAIHGSWSNFTEAIANRTKDGGIWGAVRTQGVEPVGPQPPTESPNDDSSKWGVGEEADFINLAPVFDVAGSGYIFKDAKDHYPEGKKTPAQATATSALTRVSKRLLRAMHHGQINLGLHMFPEMYPESTALHHGLKIVVFPLPMYLDYAKLPELIERHFNDKEGRTLMNVPYQYSDVWHRMSYWANIDKKTTFGDELYKRWLAYVGVASCSVGGSLLMLSRVVTRPRGCACLGSFSIRSREFEQRPQPRGDGQMTDLQSGIYTSKRLMSSDQTTHLYRSCSSVTCSRLANRKARKLAIAALMRQDVRERDFDTHFIHTLSWNITGCA